MNRIERVSNMRRFRRIATKAIWLIACAPLPAQVPVAEHGSLKWSAVNIPAVSNSASSAEANAAPAAVFVENQGQFDPAVKYMFTSPAGTVWLTTTGIVFDGVRGTGADGERLGTAAAPPAAEFRVQSAGHGGPAKTGPDGSSPERVQFSETFDGSNPNIAIEAVEAPPGTSGSLPGTDAAGWPIRAFSTVVYKDVWPGISMRLSGTRMGIEQEFILEAGANSDNIAVSYEGIDGMTIDEHGSLVIATALGTLRRDVPMVYQEVGGHRIAGPSPYKLTGPGTYGFQLDTYGREDLMVIGPTRLDFSQSSSLATGTPIINFFNVAPTSTLPGQAAIGTLSVSGATAATINGAAAHCSNGECAGTILFYPTSTTDYVLEATGAGGNANGSQQVEVGHYKANPLPLPAGLQVTWQGACWLRNYPKQYCDGACQGMAFKVNIPTPPKQLPLEATLYLGATKCNPSRQDNLNDYGTLTGSGGWIFWFSNHPNKRYTSAIWTIGNQSSGCVSYAEAPDCP